MDVHHLALWVSDMDATRSFYADTIGLDRVRSMVDGDTEHFFVRGETDHQIQFKCEPGRTVAADRSQIDHLAIVVDDLAATLDRVRAGPTDVVRKPVTIEEGVFGTQTVAFVADPDGYVLALIEPQ